MATFTATERRSANNLAVGQGAAYTVKNLCSTVTITAATATGSTIDFGNIPSNARILGASTLYWDDLGTGTAPDIDLGLVGSQITNDVDALNDGLDGASATSARVVKDIANIGLPAWDYVNGQTTDPGGVFGVQGIFTTAATDTEGDVTLDLYYVID